MLIPNALFMQGQEGNLQIQQVWTTEAPVLTGKFAWTPIQVNQTMPIKQDKLDAQWQNEN